ncbi:unnamed protein product [Bursaphelenchus okinawaensis]|uniref:Uncharacterized protein n=1 Tax=Bursaphelenchus okinawaensis TaxID=465554 RepID=A0A811K8B9_9BILA|nr:unnamed protein product [Bursaphelenchus okinawaensis]CAG9093063.1 unnamed protein product [Bursaphelenchus okinawaensis]
MEFTLFLIAFTPAVSTNATLQGISTQEGLITDMCQYAFLQNTSLCGGICSPRFTVSIEEFVKQTILIV